MTFRPKSITFDCLRTMINFDMACAIRDHFGDKLTAEQLEKFISPS